MNAFIKIQLTCAIGLCLASSIAWGQRYEPRRYNVKLEFEREVSLELERLDTTIEKFLREKVLVDAENFFRSQDGGPVNFDRERSEFIDEYKAAVSGLMQDYFLWIDNFSPELVPVDESLLQTIYNSAEIPLTQGQRTFAQGPATNVPRYAEFAAYLYNVAAAPVNARSWKKLQMVKLVEFHFANGLSPFLYALNLPRYNDFGSYFVKDRFLEDPSRTLQLRRIDPSRVVPKLNFNELTILNFFAEELSKRSGPVVQPIEAAVGGQLKSVVLNVKNLNFNALVTYNDLAVSGFEYDRGGSPLVIRAATCFGTCVSIDKSGFSAVIGSFSYAWQLLYLDDVVPETRFFELYSSGLTQQFLNIGWSLWATMIAFPPTEGRLTIRSTQSFKEIMREVEESVVRRDF